MKNPANLLIMLMLISQGFQAFSNDKGPAEKISSGYIKIKGSTNIGDFELEYRLDKEKKTEVYIQHQNADNSSCLIIPAREFNGRSPRLEADFCSLVKSDLYPDIAVGFHMIGKDYSPDDSLTNIVSITLAGQIRHYEIPGFSVIRKHNSLQLSGVLVIPLSDFLLNPPSRFLGLIRMKEHIDVDFSVIFTEDSEP